MIKPQSAVRKSMKRIWRMAGVGLLVVSVGSQAMADETR